MAVKVDDWQIVGLFGHGDSGRKERFQFFVIAGIGRPIGERSVNARLQSDIHGQTAGGELGTDLRHSALKALSNREDIHVL